LDVTINTNNLRDEPLKYLARTNLYTLDPNGATTMTLTAEAFIEQYERTTNTHNLEATLSLIDEEAIYLFSNGTVHVGKEAIKSAIGRNFEAIQDEEYSITNLTWVAKTQELAVCVYDFAWSGMVNGETASGSGRGTSVLKRWGKSWKVVHEHLSKGNFAA
jgi:ketosteroid isomerase-like protein